MYSTCVSCVEGENGAAEVKGKKWLPGQGRTRYHPTFKLRDFCNGGGKIPITKQQGTDGRERRNLEELMEFGVMEVSR